MAPRISPGKSWEGAAASLVFSIVFTMLLLPRVLPIAMVMAALVGFAGNLAGQLGDLAESALKRSVGAKDSGTLLPGHGGFLDRVDSALFTLPVVYALIVWLHL
jgi:phosphatidate cytidylyltransferase